MVRPRCELFFFNLAAVFYPNITFSVLHREAIHSIHVAHVCGTRPVQPGPVKPNMDQTGQTAYPYFLYREAVWLIQMGGGGGLCFCMRV